MSKSKNVQIDKNNVIDLDKTITVESYKMQGNHVILKPTQFLAFEETFKSLLVNFEAVGVAPPEELNLDSHIITALQGITKCEVVSYQVGADRSTNESDIMRKVRKDIEAILADNFDVILNGKRMFLDTNNVPKEGSFTFTLRTPTNKDRLEYVKELQDELLKVRKSTKEVINK